MIDWEQIEADLISGKKNVTDLTWEEYQHQSSHTVLWCLARDIKRLAEKVAKISGEG